MSLPDRTPVLGRGGTVELGDIRAPLPTAGNTPYTHTQSYTHTHTVVHIIIIRTHCTHSVSELCKIGRTNWDAFEGLTRVDHRDHLQIFHKRWQFWKKCADPLVQNSEQHLSDTKVSMMCTCSWVIALVCSGRCTAGTHRGPVPINRSGNVVCSEIILDNVAIVVFKSTSSTNLWLIKVLTDSISYFVTSLYCTTGANINFFFILYCSGHLCRKTPPNRRCSVTKILWKQRRNVKIFSRWCRYSFFNDHSITDLHLHSVGPEFRMQLDRTCTEMTICYTSSIWPFCMLPTKQQHF